MKVYIRRQQTEGKVRFNIISPRFLKSEGLTFYNLKVLQDAGCDIMDLDALLAKCVREN